MLIFFKNLISPKTVAYKALLINGDRVYSWGHPKIRQPYPLLKVHPLFELGTQTIDRSSTPFLKFEPKFVHLWASFIKLLKYVKKLHVLTAKKKLFDHPCKKIDPFQKFDGPTPMKTILLGRCGNFKF